MFKISEIPDEDLDYPTFKKNLKKHLATNKRNLVREKKIECLLKRKKNKRKFKRKIVASALNKLLSKKFS